jgi:hypothetical protein
VNLLEFLRSKQDGERLATQIEDQIRPEAEKRLKHATALFPQFTDHSVEHSDRVVDLLGYLIPELVAEKLNAWEIYFLIAATYLHDLGMILECPGVPEGPDWDAFVESQIPQGQEFDPNRNQELLAKYVRDRHHLRSEAYIRSHKDVLGLRASDTIEEPEIVARIARGHRKDDLGDPGLFAGTVFGIGQVIRTDLLAAYLRLADDLDVTASRTPLAEHEVVSLTDPRSKEEWEKHIHLTGISKDFGVIRIHGRCTDPETYPLLLGLRRELDQKLQVVRSAIGRTYVGRDGSVLENPIPYRQVELDIRHEGFFPVQVRFELEKDQIIDLLLGERLYGDKTASVRELLQNAVDTCHEAAFFRPASWKPEITIKHDVSMGVLTISDNGMGMNLSIIEEYFSRIGRSYYRSSEFASKFRPISEFGIGFLSSFMIADPVEIESKREGFDPVLLHIRSPNEPFVPRVGSKVLPGTIVRLRLKEDVNRDLDLIGAAAHYAKYVDVPILATGPDGITRPISRQELKPSADEILEGIMERASDLRLSKEPHVGKYLQSKNIAEYYDYEEQNGIRVGVVLLDKLFADFDYLSNREHGWTSSREVQTRIYQDGFYVSHLRAAIIDNQLTWVVVDVSGEEHFNLTANRSAFAGDDLDLWRKIFEIYSLIIERFYAPSMDEDNSQNWWDFHLRYYSGDSSEIPGPLETAALEGAKYCTLAASGFEQVSLAEVRDNSSNLYWVPEFNHEVLVHLLPLFAPGDRLLVIPAFSGPGYTRAPGWKWKLTDISDERGLAEFLLERGARFDTITVFGARMVVVDLGCELGVWGLPLGWQTESDWDEVTAIFDARHPLTAALRDIEEQEVSMAIEHFAAQLFEEHRDWETFQAIQKEFVLALRGAGLIDESAALTLEAVRTENKHDCPYPLVRDFTFKI